MKCKKCGRAFKISECGTECPFCFAIYTFTKDELDKLYNDALVSEKNKRFTDAAAKFKVVAQEGAPIGIYRYGECLEWGRGVKQSTSEALELYAKASKMGSAEASLAYYKCVMDKNLQGEYLDEAIYRLRIAAMLENEGAMYELAKLYEDGSLFPPSKKSAILWYSKAADGGNADAMLALAFIYSDGNTTTQNNAYAKWYLQKASHNGLKNKKLSLMLARVQSEAPKIEHSDYARQLFDLALEAEMRKEWELAFTMFLKAGQLGSAKSQYRTALCYSQGLGIEKNEALAVEWYKKASEKGYIDAIIALGNCYRYGKGAEQNDNKCLQCYQRSADLGDARAEFILAECYFNGSMVERDVPKGVRLYQRSALKAYAPAILKINDIFDQFAKTFNRALEAQNSGNHEKAIRLYTVAAEMGHRASACNLGYCYQIGEGCKKDMKKAVYYYKIAAKDGSATAKYNLGICYKQGGGVNVDFKEATRLLTEAREGGYGEKAEQLLRQIRQRKIEKIAQSFYSASCSVYRKGDVEGAIKLRVASAKLGNARAEFFLGCHFEFGDGLPKDQDKAKLWYLKAKQHGFIDPVSEMKQAYLREKRLLEIMNKVD